MAQDNRNDATLGGPYPAPAGVLIRWIGGGSAEILAGNPDGVPGRGIIAEITPEELGTAGMQTVIHIVNMLGLAYTFAVDVEGSPHTSQT